ncbi:hypothetical protein GLX_01090 [Komagataeibacter medellinensis NBRC 3288]|uniref:Uncharacterized protein n=1 Tax=Komagataeibacter medellinensis (strain NBRC 3288 / BCRC 11682 / LMG 1693 / Kondo 51) TaxID=634177 RepID=G2I2A5_KOMMN|nr:hypothetical protein GLX_01090 [Komagataeibacter medellinensis NBRC 3288]
MIGAGWLEHHPGNGFDVADPAQKRGLALAGVGDTNGITAGVTGSVEMILGWDYPEFCAVR